MTYSLGSAEFAIGVNLSQLVTGISSAKTLVGGLGTAVLGAAGIVGGLGVASIKAGADMQEGMTQLVTGAGESEKMLGRVRDGIFQVSDATGTSAKDLISSMFLIDSASYTAANGGLTVLRIAAEGAKVGNADLTQTTDILTTSLHDYHLSASEAVPVTNSLIDAVKFGKMHMDDLNQSLTNVLPVASNFHVSLTDVEAALSTMAGAGDRGAAAGTHLAMMLKMLENPSGTAAKEMKAMGLNSIELAQEMSTSLPTALQMIQDAVSQHFTPGSVEYNRAIAAILGGAKSGTAGLELMGQNMQQLSANAKDLSTAFAHGGTDIQGWSLVQQDFNQQLSEAQQAVSNFGTEIGMSLLPVLTPLVTTIGQDLQPVLKNMSTWFTNTGLPAVEHFGRWFTDTAEPVLKGWGEMILRNVVPPVESLIGNVVTLGVHLGTWLEQSGTLSGVLSAVTTTMGTLVGWMAGFVGWIDKGGPGVATFAGALSSIATTIGLMKIEDFAAGVFLTFQHLSEGNGIVANLANQAFPQLSQALGWTATQADAAATSIEAIGPASVEAEAVVETSTAGMSLALGVATAGISLLVGMVAASIVSSQHTAANAVDLMSAGTKQAYNDLGTSQADMNAKAQAKALETSGAISGYYHATGVAIKQASDDAKARYILDQQAMQDAAEKAAAAADAAWVNASNDSATNGNIDALLQQAGWSPQKTAAYTGGTPYSPTGTTVGVNRHAVFGSSLSPGYLPSGGSPSSGASGGHSGASIPHIEVHNHFYWDGEVLTDRVMTKAVTQVRQLQGTRR